MSDAEPKAAERSPWNSLEIAKLTVGVATPVMLFLVGQQITSASAEQSRAETRAAQAHAEESAAYSKVVEKRVEMWDKMAVPLNDIYAYMLQVGHWKSLSEADIIARKRQTDAIVHANRPFFSDEFFNAYTAFMKSVFEMYGGIGEDAKLRTSADLQLKGNPARFTGEDNRAAIHTGYYDLLDVVARELNLKIVRPELPKVRTARSRGDRIEIPSDGFDVAPSSGE